MSSCTLVSPQLVELWSCVSSPLLSHTPHRRRIGGSGGATQRGVWSDLGGVSQFTLRRQGWSLVHFIFIFYFVRLQQCDKYSDVIVTFISIHSVIVYVVFLAHVWDAPGLFLKSGCDIIQCIWKHVSYYQTQIHVITQVLLYSMVSCFIAILCVSPSCERMVLNHY
jgi:hypothetical protein